METFNSINERIRYVVEHEGHTVGSFARKCGVPDSTVRNLFTAEDRKPSYDLICRIIRAVNQPWCDANWLVLGQQPAVEATDTRHLQKLIEQQQQIIAKQQATIDKLTDKLGA